MRSAVGAFCLGTNLADRVERRLWADVLLVAGVVEVLECDLAVLVVLVLAADDEEAEELVVELVCL